MVGVFFDLNVFKFLGVWKLFSGCIVFNIIFLCGMLCVFYLVLVFRVGSGWFFIVSWKIFVLFCNFWFGVFWLGDG